MPFRIDSQTKPTQFDLTYGSPLPFHSKVSNFSVQPEVPSARVVGHPATAQQLVGLQKLGFPTQRLHVFNEDSIKHLVHVFSIFINYICCLFVDPP